jgi:2-methylisocitrate lyase-like PEP mutase family enzyme
MTESQNERASEIAEEVRQTLEVMTGKNLVATTIEDQIFFKRKGRVRLTIIYLAYDETITGEINVCVNERSEGVHVAAAFHRYCKVTNKPIGSAIFENRYPIKY